MPNRLTPPHAAAGRRVFDALGVVAWFVALSVGWSVGARANGDARPPEHVRGNVGTFREVLKRHGLTELLDLHLQDFPPDGSVNSMLMLRDLRLATSADTRVALSDRAVAAAAANQILERVIEKNPDDRRRLDWLFTLARSIVYDQAEPLFTAVLYRGGNSTVRGQLVELTTRSLDLLSKLRAELTEVYREVDQLSIRQFELLESSGYIEAIDLLGPRADYLRLWALFYNAIGRQAQDPLRLEHLRSVVEYFDAQPSLLDTAHEISGVRVQALLLAGMVHRRLEKYIAARGHLTSTLEAFHRVSDSAQRNELRWAATLAHLELVRSARDDGDFKAALRRLKVFREEVVGKDDGNFGLLIVTALEERAVYRAKSREARTAGDERAALRSDDRSWQALYRLADRMPARRDELYATVMSIVDRDADPSTLDPLEQCATVASLLFEADEAGRDRDGRLAHAIAVGDRFASTMNGAAEVLLPEVLFNTAVAQYRRGHVGEAVSRFLVVARDHAEFSQAAGAAKLAVQLSSELYDSATGYEVIERRLLYRDALEVLLTNFDFDEGTRYWRFFHAQLLAELGEYDRAAAEYRLVHEAHEHFLASLFYRARCIALSLMQDVAAHRADPLATRRRVAEFFSVRRRFVKRATDRRGQPTEDANADHLHGLLAQIEVLAAEVQALSGVERYGLALENLADFERRYPDQLALTGRVWRVRLVAFEKLGRLEEAVHAVPAYVAAQPETAGPALQSLYVACVEAARRKREDDTEAIAGRRAMLALRIAEQIVEWADHHPHAAAGIDRRALQVQLAEAALRAGRHEMAKELFQVDLESRGATSDRAIDVRADYGYAESLYRLNRLDDALPRFNKIVRTLAPSHELRWRALLRDLQCRAALGEPGRGIVKVIEQQKYLHPEMGGPDLAREFAELLRESQRRADGEG